MNREDELIREALKLNISASDEINNRVLRTVERKTHWSGIGRAVMIVATWCIIIFGTGFAANAATGGIVVEYLRGKIDNLTYVFGNGSNTEQKIIQKDGEEWEQVKYIEDNVVMSHLISEDETEYSLYLKVADTNENFISLVASVKEGRTTEEQYYVIRGEFLSILTGFQNPNEKNQILAGLKEAAENTDTTFVRDALLDLASDYENNHRILYVNFPGKWWGEVGDIVIFEDISNVPSGEVAIIVDTVDDTEKSWIFVLRIDDEDLLVNQYGRGEIYSEKCYQELIENEIPIYDLRKTK